MDLEERIMGLTAVYRLQVLVKFRGSFSELSEMILRHRGDLVSGVARFEVGQSDRRLEGVADLSAVPLQIPQVLLRILDNALLVGR